MMMAPSWRGLVSMADRLESWDEVRTARVDSSASPGCSRRMVRCPFRKGVCGLLVYKGICESINTIVYIVVKKGWRDQAADLCKGSGSVPLEGSCFEEERMGIIVVNVLECGVFLTLQKE